MVSIQDILDRQRIELSERLRQQYVTREVVIPSMDTDLIKVILGPRRSGKSFFCSHSLAEVQENYGYVNFDDEHLYRVEEYDRIIAAVNAIYKHPKYLMLDEVQNLPRWELFINRLQRQGFRLIVTGSNAHLLSSELATHLTGRHLPVVLFPFSFPEYLEAVARKDRRTDFDAAAMLNSYLRDGGFPETAMTGVNAHDYIATLFNAVIYKDIVKRHRLSNAGNIDNLARYLLSNAGSEYSFRRLTQVANCKSDRTVRKYLRFLEEAFLFFPLERYSHKFSEQVAFNKKAYAIDNGFITATGFSMSSDTGRLAENAVAIALKKSQLQGRINFYFWKSPQHEEVDFVIVQNRKIRQLIQVCWNLAAPKVIDREIRALLKAGKELKCSDLLVLSEDREETRDATWFGLKGTVRFQPLWKWLSEEHP